MGKRYGAEEALGRSIVDAAVPEAEVVSAAAQLVAPLAGKAHPAMSRLKREMYPGELAILEADSSEVSAGLLQGG